VSFLGFLSFCEDPVNIDSSNKGLKSYQLMEACIEPSMHYKDPYKVED